MATGEPLAEEKRVSWLRRFWCALWDHPCNSYRIENGQLVCTNCGERTE